MEIALRFTVSFLTSSVALRYELVVFFTEGIEWPYNSYTVELPSCEIRWDFASFSLFMGRARSGYLPSSRCFIIDFMSKVEDFILSKLLRSMAAEKSATLLSSLASTSLLTFSRTMVLSSRVSLLNGCYPAIRLYFYDSRFLPTSPSQSLRSWLTILEPS